MSLPLTIPTTARPILTANIFTATFNAVTPGRYDFNSAGNINQTIIQMRPRSVYIIERVNFSASTPEGTYQEAIDPTNGLPRLSVTTQSENQQRYPQEQPFINYVDNLEMLLFVNTTQNQDLLRATFRGQFDQPAGLVGQLTLNVYIQFNIYDLNATEWTEKYFDAKSRLGSHLNLRGN